MKNSAILFIWDRIGDYHYARIKACEKILDSSVYTADLAGTDALYKWNSIDNNKHTVLSLKAVEQKDFFNRFRKFRSIIKENKITAVAMPYGRLEYHTFLLYARFRGIRTIIFSESWYSRGRIKDFLKSILLKFLGDYFFVSGVNAFNHFKNVYKINPDKILKGYSVIDNNHFEIEDSAEKKHIICVARYSEEKNLLFLIRCFAKSTINKKYQLLLVGDGPQRMELQKLIDQLNLNYRVTLTGWVSYEHLPVLYSSSVCAILPSKFEPWGLVVNETMAAGLPILISNTCGCRPDLLEENKNGWSFDPYNEEGLINLFNTFSLLSQSEVEEMGMRSKSKINSFTPDIWSCNILLFLQR
jgi:1,2-diacylglycerol 3-alpha-glucosyltransferase